MKRSTLLVLVLSGGLLVACGSAGSSPSSQVTSPSAPSPTPRDVTFKVTFKGTPPWATFPGIIRQNDTAGSPCGTSSVTKPTDPFAYMAAGNQITVTNEKKETIAVGTLPDGTTSNAGKRGTDSFDCNWLTTIPKVPAATFYTFTLGGTALPTLSRADLEATGWVAGWTLTS